MAPNPIFILSKGEDGLESLIRCGQLPETPYFPVCRNWEDMLDYCGQLVTEKHDRKTLIIDVCRGVERMLEEHVIATEFRGRADNFHSFAAGRKFTVPAWKRFLNDTLGAIHNKGITIVLLAHSKTKNIKTPMNEDILTYYPDSEECYWDESKKWVDQICHLTRKGLVDRDVLQRAKKYGDDHRNQNQTIAESRVICCDQSIFYTGGGRLGLPDQIDLPEISKPRYPWQGAEAGWKVFSDTIRTCIANSVKAAKAYAAQKAKDEESGEGPKKIPGPPRTTDGATTTPQSQPPKQEVVEQQPVLAAPPQPPANEPSREPGDDEISCDDQPATDAQRNLIFSTMTKLKINWKDPGTQAQIAVDIGRDLPDGNSKFLTVGEAKIIQANLDDALAAKQAKAAQKEAANAGN